MLYTDTDAARSRSPHIWSEKLVFLIALVFSEFKKKKKDKREKHLKITATG